MRPPGRKRCSNAIRSGTVLEAVAHDRRREQEQRPRKDDRHHARIIHFQRHVLRLAAVHFPPDHAFRVLHSDFTDPLRNRYHCGDNKDEDHHEQHQHHRVHLARSLPRWNKSLPSLHQRSGQPRHNPYRDDERDAVADTALGDLIAQPHQNQCAGR